MFKTIRITAVLLPILGANALHAASLLGPGDAIFALDLDAQSSLPGAGEGPNSALDANSGTKYLNFGERHSGLIFTPGATTIQSFTITTANDSAERDPTSYLFFGSNQAITSTDHSNGFADHWTLIGMGTLSPSTDRFSTGSAVNLSMVGSFSSYWMVFPTVRDAGAANSMQVADVQFFSGLDGGGSMLDTSSLTAIPTGWASDTPTSGNEEANFLLDGNSGTKYLNFGEANSGFEVIPSVGPTIVESFIMTTANDAPERDPSAWALFGRAASGVWSAIDSGVLDLPTDRLAVGDEVFVSNTEVYEAYRMVFTDVRDAGAANSMQLADIQFFGTIIPEPATSSLFAFGIAGLLLRRRK